jgi:hypothetical protein
MSGQTAKPFASVALLVLMSGANLTLPANPARADDCRSAPNSPAPAGTHWYYRLDWATQRKCWYVRAPGRHTNQATAPAMIMPTTASHSAPAPSDPTPVIDAAPMSPSHSDTTPPPPHAETSALKPISAPASSRTIDGTPGQSVLTKVPRQQKLPLCKPARHRKQALKRRLQRLWRRRPIHRSQLLPSRFGNQQQLRPVIART